MFMRLGFQKSVNMEIYVVGVGGTGMAETKMMQGFLPCHPPDQGCGRATSGVGRAEGDVLGCE